jgi:DNA-binding NarL/FixJ family response regulator
VAQTVLIVDDHAGFRRFAKRLLEAGGLTVVGEAQDGASAVAEATRLGPDVVLLDVKLPDRDGFDVAAEIAGHTAVVLTSSHDFDDLRTRVERTAARGFIPKADLSADALRSLLR